MNRIAALLTLALTLLAAAPASAQVNPEINGCSPFSAPADMEGTACSSLDSAGDLEPGTFLWIVSLAADGLEAPDGAPAWVANLVAILRGIVSSPPGVDGGGPSDDAEE